MLYSVWKADEKRYDYYATPKESVDDPTATHLAGAQGLGVDNESGSWPLPTNARYVGSGRVAKGMIASRHARFGLGAFSPMELGKPVLLGLAAYGAFKLLF